MYNKHNYQDCNWYKDKNGKLIRENDMLLFDNGHWYKCVVLDSVFCLQCLSIDIPLILLEKSCVGKWLSSGCIVKKTNII